MEPSKKPGLAVITIKLSNSNTFFFRELESLSKTFRVTLYVFFPLSRKVANLKKTCPEVHIRCLFRLCFLPGVIRDSFHYVFSRRKGNICLVREILYLQREHAFKALYFLFMIPFLITCAYHIRKRKDRHIHAYWANYSATAASLISGLISVPYSISAHAHDLTERPGILVYNCSRAAGIVCCSRHARERLLAKTGNEFAGIITVCHHGTDLNVFRNAWKYAPVKNTLRILTIGRIVPKKGHMLLIRALKILAGETGGKHILWCIAGPVTRVFYYLQIRKQIRRLPSNININHYTWLSREEVIHALCRTDIYIQPSVTEVESRDTDGIPNSLIEAMSTGVPVIATKTGGIPEIMDHGLNGIMVEPGLPGDMAQAIREIMNNPEAAIQRAKNARIFVEKHFDCTTNGKILEDILLEYSK